LIGQRMDDGTTLAAAARETGNATIIEVVDRFGG
jgi:hypothetical protein